MRLPLYGFAIFFFFYNRSQTPLAEVKHALCTASNDAHMGTCTSFEAAFTRRCDFGQWSDGGGETMAPLHSPFAVFSRQIAAICHADAAEKWPPKWP